MSKKIIFGVAFNWNETGTEGPIPAVQDKRHISLEGQWDYKGLITLKSGDRLIIYDNDSDCNILYEKVLDMQVPSFTTALGRPFTCYNEVPSPAHLSYDSWKEFYDLMGKDHPCILIRG